MNILQYNEEKVVMMETKKLWIQAMREKKSRKIRLNYEALLLLAGVFPDIDQYYASVDKDMPVNVQEALTRGGWKLMDKGHMRRILDENLHQQVEICSKLFHNLLNHCVSN